MQRLYTCDEIAVMFSVKVPTVWTWIRSGKLSAYKFGRTFQIGQQQLDDFVDSCNVSNT